MSFSYDTSLASFKDRVRFFSGDTVSIPDSNGDEELAALESYEPNLFLAAAQACENIGLRVGQRAYLTDTAANVQGGLRVDRRQQPKWWFDRAKTLRDRATNPAMNADEIIQTFDFDVDVYGFDWSEYTDSDAGSNLHQGDFLLWNW